MNPWADGSQCTSLQSWALFAGVHVNDGCVVSACSCALGSVCRRTNSAHHMPSQYCCGKSIQCCPRYSEWTRRVAYVCTVSCVCQSCLINLLLLMDSASIIKRKAGVQCWCLLVLSEGIFAQLGATVKGQRRVCGRKLDKVKTEVSDGKGWIHTCEIQFKCELWNLHWNRAQKRKEILLLKTNLMYQISS